MISRLLVAGALALSLLSIAPTPAAAENGQTPDATGGYIICFHGTCYHYDINGNLFDVYADPDCALRRCDLQQARVEPHNWLAEVFHTGKR